MCCFRQSCFVGFYYIRKCLLKMHQASRTRRCAAHSTVLYHSATSRPGPLPGRKRGSRRFNRRSGGAQAEAEEHGDSAKQRLQFTWTQHIERRHHPINPNRTPAGLFKHPSDAAGLGMAPSLHESSVEERIPYETSVVKY